MRNHAEKLEDRVKTAVLKSELRKAAVLNSLELAQLMGLSHQAVRNALYRGLEGKTIPPSFTLGRRRVWLCDEALRWLKRRATYQQRNPRRGAKKMDIPRIVEGLELVDEDGDEVVVSKINPKKRTVTLESDDETYDMPLRDLRKALLAGEFGCVVDIEDDDGEDDEDDGEEK